MDKKLSKDFDIFGGVGEEAQKGAPAPRDDIFNLGDEAPAEEPTKEDKDVSADKAPKEEAPADEPTDEPNEEAPEEEPVDNPEEPIDDTSEEEDIIAKLLGEAATITDDLQDSPDLSAEDKKKISELSVINSELEAKVDTLTRLLETAREVNNKNLESGEELVIFKPLITKLEKDPQLMLFAKHYGTKNETMKARLADICKDMLYDLTGIDVYSVMNEETKSAATAFGTEDEAPAPIPEKAKPEKSSPTTRKRDATFPMM